ncbi:NAD(P)-binding protein [Hypoxylon cercidicola]|nr:NAD(P)-binding protein [Hypoxylon cercidicola]
MAGSVVLTGANSSLGVHAVEHLLKKYPQYTAILTVRNASDTDVNTKRLREVISHYPDAKTSIHQLDLCSLSATHAFADIVRHGVVEGQYLPLSAIICNAYYWNLVGDPELTADGYDKTMQVNYISYAALVLRLLGNFGNGGRIILISSDAHWPGKNPMEKYPPTIPTDLELLINPSVDEDKQGRGYQRYATSKLVLTAWGYALNRYLQKEENLRKITVIVMNPGNLVDSRALRSNTPQALHRMQRFIYKPLLPLLRFADSTLRTAAPAGTDVIEVAVSPKYLGESGFFTLLKKDQSSPESNDEAKQASLWAQTLIWTNIGKFDTALQPGFA